MKTFARFVFLACLTVSVAGLARAEIKDAAANGFDIEISVNIRATPDVVYRAFVDSIGRWWESSHTFSGDSRNLYLEPVVGGCFCERLPTGGGVRHLGIVFVDPARRINFEGGLGPLQTMAVTGAMSIALTPEQQETRFQLTYRVGGYLKEGLDTLAPVVDGVLLAQVGRLKNFVELGSPGAGG